MNSLTSRYLTDLSKIKAKSRIILGYFNGSV
jgi:hypothetical protein